MGVGKIPFEAERGEVRSASAGGQQRTRLTGVNQAGWNLYG